MPRLKHLMRFIIVLLSSNLSWGLPSDREQPINIQANSAEQKTTNGKEVTLYKGDVVMTQGTLNIKGNVVTVYSENRTVTKVVAVGERAYFSQVTEQDALPIEARANTIEYKLSKDTIVMLNDATLTQGGSLVTGERIDYNTVTAQVKAKGKTKTTAEGETTGRVNMILEPSRKSDDEKTDQTSTDNDQENPITPADSLTATPNTEAEASLPPETETETETETKVEPKQEAITTSTPQAEPTTQTAIQENDQEKNKDANGHPVSQ